MKRILALILAVLMLSGCQLASEEKREDQLQDKLVGVFVTFEHLDLEFDIEGWLRANPGALGDGDITLEPGEGMAYEEKLWASVTEEGWSFPGIDGLIMGQMWKDDHWAGFSTEGFSEMKTAVEQTETLDSVAEEGTIYIPFDTDAFIFYSNPVYMTPDGAYYAQEGSGFSGDGMAIGGMSQSIKCEIKETLDGVEKEYSAEYTVRIEGVKLAEKVVLVQMSAEHTELDRAEYLPNQMPESVTPAADAAYLIVEEYADDEVTRTLCQPGCDPIRIFCQEEQVYCLPRFTEILWES